MNVIVDSATFDELLSLFELDKIDQTFDWNYQAANTLTSILFKRDINIMISPSIKVEGIGGRQGKLYSLLDYCTKPISNVSENQTVNNDKALTQSKRFITRKIDDFSRILLEAKNNESYDRWLVSEKRNAWEDFINFYGGAFNLEYLKSFSKIYNISEIELKKLYKFSSNPKAKFPLEDMKVLKDLYFASVIFRGIFHQELSKLNNFSLLQHPVRQKITINSPNNQDNFQKDVTNTEFFLSHLILISAFNYKSFDKRLEYWALSVRKVYSENLVNDRNLEDKLDSDKAFDKAVNIMKYLGISNHSRIDNYIDLLLSFSIGSLVFFKILAHSYIPFLGPTISAAQKATGKTIGQKIDNELRKRKRKKGKEKIPEGIIIPKYIEKKNKA